MRVLSLCDRTGNMVKPWADAGHYCEIVDVRHDGCSTVGMVARVGLDVRRYEPTRTFDVVFAFPPCTHLAGSGARWWEAKGAEPLADAMSIVKACLRIIESSHADVWMLENPVGRLSSLWREPNFTFDPCDYGGYLTPPGDHYTKRTCLWTGPDFAMPEPKRVAPTEGSKMHLLPPSAARADLRSETPMGFAVAVYEANKERRQGKLFA